MYSSEYSPRPFQGHPPLGGGMYENLSAPSERGGRRRSRLGEYSERHQTIAPYMDTSATGNSAPESRIPFNARIQVRENGLKSRWNFGLRARRAAAVAFGQDLFPAAVKMIAEEDGVVMTAVPFDEGRADGVAAPAFK